MSEDTVAAADGLSIPRIAELARTALGALGRPGGAVAVVGSLNADLTVTTERLPRPGETVSGGPLAAMPGGKSANQAVACGLLGLDTAMVGAVGADAQGTMLLTSLGDVGVDISGVRRRETPTGTALITVDAHGENTIVVSAGANATLDARDIALSDAVLRRSGVLGLCLEVGDEALLAAAAMARSSDALIVFNPSPLRALPAGLLGLTDVLIVNEHELAALTCSDCLTTMRRAAAQLAVLGVDRAVVTLGAEGSAVLDRGRVHRLPAFDVHVVDTTGCGDAYTGALLAALASGLGMLEGAALASAVAALAATRAGTQRSYPDAAEVLDFLSAI